VHVPYKGAPPAMQAVLAGEVSMFCGPIFQGLPHVKSGQLKALGVTGAKPSSSLLELAPLSVQGCRTSSSRTGTVYSLRPARRRRYSIRSAIP